MSANQKEPENQIQLIFDQFKDFGDIELSDAALNVKKWMSIGFRLFGNMLDNSDYSFFISFPQFISQLSFLMAVCQEKTTGLRSEFGWNPTNAELAHQVQHKNLMENTESFMKVWKKELMIASKPGQIHSARRALCYPKYAVSIHLNTLECLRRYLVELKLFEGATEHRNWISQQLKGKFEKQVVVNVWKEESLDGDDNEGRKKQAEEPTTVAEEIEKKPPILMWISNASIAILPELFDVKFVYTFKEIDYFRVAATPSMAISERNSEMPWSMIVLPCVNSNLCFVLVYNFCRNLCSYEDLRVHINDHRQQAPCIVRPRAEHPRGAGNDEETMALNGKSKKNCIYFPYWNEANFHPNKFAEELQRTVDIEETFNKGGYGDLASPKASPSPGGDMYKIAHLQNFAILNFFNAPSTRFSTVHEQIGDDSEQPLKIAIDEHVSENEIVPFPFCAILWDTNRCVPVYMGKITGRNVDYDKEPEKKAMWKCLYEWIRFQD